jgi:hypothetical protein
MDLWNELTETETALSKTSKYRITSNKRPSNLRRIQFFNVGVQEEKIKKLHIPPI